ncbi:hypothetical protein FOMPIDRAFT_91599 [Fomitopsis schrenkii]|uniref:Uncharacterized protein n=1 Tax=Fomitopsis schrenkii TaxID=2126942 RepID=S8EAZ2_FOMSC|nr:hypothetical protein FOMPIDRAFT_91599 [Fomitopsis schrenkii]
MSRAPLASHRVLLQVDGAAARVPLEVFEMVTSHVDVSDDLSSCSLVCRLWSAAARRRLFRVVKISARQNGLPSSSSLLCDPTSTILPFVHTIRLEEGVDYDVVHEEGLLGPISMYMPAPRESRTPFLDDVLPTIRTRDLTALRSLEVVDLTWAELSTESRRAFFDLCPLITSLSLFCLRGQGISSSGMVELLGGVTEVSSLQKLYVSDPHIFVRRYILSDNQPIPSPPTKATISLKSLTMEGDCMTPFLPGLLAVFAFPHITDLILRDIAPDNVGDLVSLLRGCASNVERLQLRFDKLLIGHYMSERDHADVVPESLFLTQEGLSGLTALRSVHLTADPRWLPAMLRPLSTCKHLEDLTIHASPCMLYRCDLDKLALSLFILARARTSLRIIFFCDLDTDHYRKRSPAGPALDQMRDQLASKLTDLLQEGRLQFLRYVRDPESRTAARDTDDIEEF